MRRILITGGGSGIGRAIAQHYADQGDDVTIAGRRMDALAETDGGRGMTCKQVDVTDETSVKALFDKPYDVVIANAGAGTAMRVADMPLEVWQSTLAVNLTGVFLTFREALNGMTAGGRLIAIASTAGLKGYPYVSGYCAAKHGVVGLTRALAVELAPTGITVNAVCPGFVETPMLDQSVQTIVEKTGKSADDVRKSLVGGNPQKRFIQPGEVAKTVVWLCSEAAGSVNGHALSVSGGEI